MPNQFDTTILPASTVSYDLGSTAQRFRTVYSRDLNISGTINGQKYFSPTSYGAVIDGVTDDTAAIQAAHDAAVVAGYWAVVFPAGTYKVNSALGWSPYIQAVSLGRVILTTALASGNFITISDLYGKPSPDPNATSLTRSKPFTGTFHFTNSNGANTACAFLFGGATAANYASELELNGFGVTGFNSGVFKFGYNSPLIHISNFFGNYNYGSYFSFLAGATNTGENITVDSSVFSGLAGGAATTYLLSINTAAQVDFNFTNCSFDFLGGINDAAQAALLADVNFTNSHFEWDQTARPYIDVNNGIRIKIVNAKFVTSLSASWFTPFVGRITGASSILVQNARYEFGGTVPKLYDAVSASSTLGLDHVLTSANLVTTYYTANAASTVIFYGVKFDPNGNIILGKDLASTAQVAKTYTTSHAAGNVPSETDFGIVDGGVFSGIKVKNVRDGSFNSQSIEFATQHGGATAGTYLTIAKDGNVTATGVVTSTVAIGTAPLVVASTTPVANLTCVPTTYNASGTQQAGTHIVFGNGTLVSGAPSALTVTLTGSAVFTSNSSYVVTASNGTTAANALKVTYASGSSFTITGPNTVTDAVTWMAVGN
jgi:hypothetical protein